MNSKKSMQKENKTMQQDNQCNCPLNSDKKGFSHDSECPMFVDDRHTQEPQSVPWEKEFDENMPKTDDRLLKEGQSNAYHFGFKFTENSETYTVTGWSRIKSFISKTLSQERQALVEKHIETLEKILANWGNEKMLRQQIFDLKREKARLGLTY